MRPRPLVQNQHRRELNLHSIYITQIQQRRPELPTVTLTWHACKYKVHKLHQRYILFFSAPKIHSEAACSVQFVLYTSDCEQGQQDLFFPLVLLSHIFLFFFFFFFLAASLCFFSFISMIVFLFQSSAFHTHSLSKKYHNNTV